MVRTADFVKLRALSLLKKGKTIAGMYNGGHDKLLKALSSFSQLWLKPWLESNWQRFSFYSSFEEE